MTLESTVNNIIANGAITQERMLKFSLYIGKWLLTHDGLFRLNNHESVNKKYRWSQWDKVTMG